MATGPNAPVVLVVDDEAAIRFLCKVNLELDGFRVVEAATLGEAREALKTSAIAVVLLDMHIGNERGETLIAELRAREPRIPVVVVSGSTEVDAIERKAGADAVLGKPFSIEDLTETVRSVASDHARPV